MNKLFPIVLALLFFGCDGKGNDNTQTNNSGDILENAWYRYNTILCEEILICNGSDCDIEEYPMIGEIEIIPPAKIIFYNDGTFATINGYQYYDSESQDWITAENIDILNWSQIGNTLYLEHPDGDFPLYNATGFEIEYINDDSLHLEMVLIDGEFSACFKQILSKNIYFDYIYEN